MNSTSFFANVALNIRRNDNINLDEDLLSIANSYGDHPSIEAIKRHMSHVDNFDFKEVSQNEVRTLLKGLNHTKSPGYDHVPPKLLNITAEEMSIPLTPLINGSIKTASFPDQLKLAELSPLFKNSDSLLTGNYRPVSVLTCISKVFERFTMTNFMSILKKYWRHSWLPSGKMSVLSMSF